MDETNADAQWKPQARASYEQRAADFIEAIRRHVELTLGRAGREAEMGPYFASVDELRNAGVAFDEAEFDWCGSSPLGIEPFDDDEEDEDDADYEVGNPTSAPSVLTAVGRWDFLIEDHEAVMQAGRAAYLKAWPTSLPEDAEERVASAEIAAGEIVHAEGMAALESTNGLTLDRDLLSFTVHQGTDDGEWDQAPFQIAED